MTAWALDSQQPPSLARSLAREREMSGSRLEFTTYEFEETESKSR